MKAINVINELSKLKNIKKAIILSSFFKTGKGEYGEGDIFWGINVPDQRSVSRKYLDLSLAQIRMLINNKVHEVRLTGFLILVGKYDMAKCEEKELIYSFYLRNLKHANNWDLIDLTAPKILGEREFRVKSDESTKLSKSINLWERRASIVSTYYSIKNGKFDKTLRIAKLLENDSHDLIHKAVGWMLREVGKMDKNTLLSYLRINSVKMPRTTLRYAIERFSNIERKRFLVGDRAKK